MDNNWYALQVTTGREDDVAAMLHRCGIQAIAPAVDRMERRAGQWEMTSHRAIPGYVFIRCRISTPLYYHLKGKPHVRRLLGQTGERFTAIPEEQIGWIAALHAATGGRAGVSTGVRHDDGSIEITGGPLLALKDRIVRIDRRNRRATVELELYDERYQISMALDVSEEPKQELRQPDALPD